MAGCGGGVPYYVEYDVGTGKIGLFVWHWHWRFELPWQYIFVSRSCARLPRKTEGAWYE